MRVITRILAIIGFVLVWSPILATIVTSLIGSLESGIFHFDFLMPAEFFPVALTGGGLLLLAALMAYLHRAIIAWGLGIAVVSLVGSQALAVLTGLNSGAARPEGWYWVLVIALIAVYSLALLVIGVGGGLLLRDLLRPSLPESKTT
jgi:hypothetical protein